MPPPSDLDFLLTAQIVVAWAGEGGETPRLGWWRTDLVSEFGGEDLFRRLTPHTWPWAVLQAVREAARRHDRERRARDADPDRLVSLYRLGFEVDELTDERLRQLKRSGAAPVDALPGLCDLLDARFDRARFSDWVRSHGEVSTVVVPVGRRIRGTPPFALEQVGRQLLAALLPLTDEYPLPHFKVAV